MALRTGEATATGDTVQSFPTEAVSINDQGNLAVLANVSGNGTGQTVIAVDFLASGAASRRRFTFPNLASNRNYLSPWRLNDGSIGVRDQASGSPPASYIRVWNEGAATMLAATTRDGFEFVSTPSFAHGGGAYAFIGSKGTTSLYLRGPGGSTRSFPVTGGGFRPMTAKDGRTVLRVNNNTQVAVMSPGGAVEVVSPAALANVGSSPGISDDGKAVAFQGESGGVPAIFACVESTGSFTNAALHTVAKPVVAGSVLPDPFQTWRDANHDGSIQAEELSGGLSGFPSSVSRVSIKEVAKPLGRQLLVVFLANGTSGQAGVYYARLDRDSGRVFGFARLAEAGRMLGPEGYSLAPSSLGLFDPLNTQTQIAFQASDGARSGVFIARAAAFTKYKQHAKNFAVTAIAAHPETAWHNQPINPNLPASQRISMSRAGCALTAVATIAGIFGKETTPLQMRNFFLSKGAIQGNDTFLSEFELKVGGKTLRMGPRGGNFGSIATELRRGYPLLLAVPSSGSTGVALKNTAPPGQPAQLSEVTLANGNLQANDKRHYIVACGLNPDLPPETTITPADVYISDPGNIGYYQTHYGDAYVTGEETLEVTLEDYFQLINSSTTYRFDAVQWFDDSAFVRKADDRVVQVRLDDRARQVSRFVIFEQVPDAFSHLHVASPVEIRVTAGGVTYASSATVARPGDIVAARSGLDLVAELDPETETGVGESEPIDPFPGYSIELPVLAEGQMAAVEIHGLAEGEYTVTLAPGAEGLAAAGSLHGTTTAGAVTAGTIRVVPLDGNPSAELSIERVDTRRALLRLPAVVGKTYQLEFSSALSGWAPAGAPVRPTSTRVEWNLDLGAASAGFYRVSTAD